MKKIKPFKAYALTLHKSFKEDTINSVIVKHYGLDTLILSIFRSKKEAKWWNDGGTREVIPVLITPIIK